MLVAGLTGGIGSGKSTFAGLLAARGAEVIDADELGRAALAPGEPAWHSVVAQFGDDIRAAGSMEIDRKRLAAEVFGDRQKLAALNAIVHPVILSRIADALDVLRGTNEIVVIDAALIVELGLDKAVDVVIVVVANQEKRVHRLQVGRGMTAGDITERIAAQSSEEDLVAAADIVVRNDGTPADLAAEADKVWDELVRRRDATHA